MIIECDTRQQKQEHIVKCFDENEIKWIRNKLYCGDYKRVDSPKTIIDTKKNLLELANNLCRTSEHKRIKGELERAKEIGCERFIFLIADEKLENIEEVKDWIIPKNKYGLPFTKAKPETLCKIMNTMNERYNVEFMLTPKEKMGEKIIEILKENCIRKTEVKR